MLQKTLLHFKRCVIFLTIFLVGCVFDLAPTPIPILPTVESSLEASIMGKWRGRFLNLGETTFDFREEDQLILEISESGETLDLIYNFIAEAEVQVSGDERVEGTGRIEFSNDRMTFTFTHAADVFGRIHNLERIDQ